MDAELLQKLKGALDRSRLSTPFLTLIANGEINGLRTEVKDTEAALKRRGVPYSHWEVIRLFKELAAAQVARFRYGRRNHGTRLEWLLDAKELSAEVLPKTGNSSLESHPTPTNELANVGSAAKSSGPTLEHKFNLRADFAVTLILPVDFNAGEAQRLQHFIGALPMPINQN
jgi:hypothetical protein